MKIKLRRGLESEWLLNNPILSDGELVFVSDKEYFKIGNGKSNFEDLKKFTECIPLDNSYIVDGKTRYKLTK